MLFLKKPDISISLNRGICKEHETLVYLKKHIKYTRFKLGEIFSFCYVQQMRKSKNYKILLDDKLFTTARNVVADEEVSVGTI